MVFESFKYFWNQFIIIIIINYDYLPNTLYKTVHGESFNYIPPLVFSCNVCFIWILYRNLNQKNGWTIVQPFFVYTSF